LGAAPVASRWREAKSERQAEKNDLSDDLSDDDVAAIMQTVARLRIQLDELDQRGFAVVPGELRKALDDVERNLWECRRFPEDHRGE
jgi:arginyl-tRNA synthetase